MTPTATPAPLKNLPNRLHHNAYVTRDLEATRHFYEDIIGLPLIATWCEVEEFFGAVREFCHLFFGLADGSALAFFKFAKPEDEEAFGPAMPHSPFHHLAIKVEPKTQDEIAARVAAAGIVEPQTFVLEHGYCKSLYVTDPNGMAVEFTVDPPNIEEITARSRANAHADLKRWLAGDHSKNNTYR